MMTYWMVARDRGNQIARELNLKKTSMTAEPYCRRRFDEILVKGASTPDHSVREELDRAYRSIRKQREIQTAVALLDLAWRIPPGPSLLEEDVVRMILRCYMGVGREGARRRIRTELRDHQYHPFPRIRQIAHQVRMADPVDGAEAMELGDTERGYPDVRIAIAERIVLHDQTEHLEDAIVYLSGAVDDPRIDRGEEEEARRVFQGISEKLGKSEKNLEILYRQYLACYENRHNTRGYLMLALGGYGSAIVQILIKDHQTHRRDRSAIEHLLMQIMRQGSPEAARALLDFLKESLADDTRRICKFLLRALTDMAARMKPGQYQVVRTEMDRALSQLEQRGNPEIRKISQEYRKLSWDAQGDDSIDWMVAQVLSGDATSFHQQVLRRLSRKSVPILLEAAEDAGRDSRERVRAVSMLGRVGATRGAELGARLWSLFRRETGDDVRIAILYALTELSLEPDTLAREDLFGLLKNSSPRLIQEIKTTWKGIFPATVPVHGNTLSALEAL